MRSGERLVHLSADVWGLHRVQLKLHGLGSYLAATDTISIMAGSQGTAVARCTGSSSCVAPYLQVCTPSCPASLCQPPFRFLFFLYSYHFLSLPRAPHPPSLYVQFDWQSPSADALTNLGLSAATVIKASPSCARTTWRPLAAPPVRVAAYTSTAVFASAGCVEVWSLEDLEVWKYVESLPASLDLADDDEFEPSSFGTAVAVSEGVMAVSTSVREKSAQEKTGGAGKSSSGKLVPAVALYVSISRKQWVLAEVIKCDTLECRHTPQPCSAPGAFPSPDESPTGCVGGGFGTSIAVKDQLLAVGIPNNNSVSMYRQQSVSDMGDELGVGVAGKSVHVGVGLVWKYKATLNGPSEGSSKLNFGAAIALSSNIVVVGYPSSEPMGGALVFSSLEDGTGVARFGEVMLDIGQQCCELQLACCNTAYVGRAVDQILQADTARVVVGDPSNDGAVLVDCDVAQMRQGLAAPTPTEQGQVKRKDNSPVCAITVYVNAPAFDATMDSHDKAEGRGWGASVALGGDLVLFGNPSRDCSGVGACGQVCHAALCPPGYCMLYDWSVDNHVCLSCSSKNSCKGGVEGCAIEQIGILAFLLIGMLGLLSLCCCLCAVNVRLILIATDPDLGWCLGPIVHVIFCIPRAHDGDDEREERLLGGEEGGQQVEEEEEDDDPVGKGYFPPGVCACVHVCVCV